MPYHISGSEKSKIVAFKPGRPMLQLIDEIELNFKTYIDVIESSYPMGLIGLLYDKAKREIQMQSFCEFNGITAQSRL